MAVAGRRPVGTARSVVPERSVALGQNTAARRSSAAAGSPPEAAGSSVAAAERYRRPVGSDAADQREPCRLVVRRSAVAGGQPAAVADGLPVAADRPPEAGHRPAVAVVLGSTAAAGTVRVTAAAGAESERQPVDAVALERRPVDAVAGSQGAVEPERRPLGQAAADAEWRRGRKERTGPGSTAADTDSRHTGVLTPLACASRTRAAHPECRPAARLKSSSLRPSRTPVWRLSPRTPFSRSDRHDPCRPPTERKRERERERERERAKRLD